jgi:hypothetical protein
MVRHKNSTSEGFLDSIAPKAQALRSNRTLLETRGLVREISPPITLLNSIVIEPPCSIWDTDVRIDESSNQECDKELLM